MRPWRFYVAGNNAEAINVFEELEAKASQLPPNVRSRIRWEKAVARLNAGDEAAAVGQFLGMAMEHFDFIKPSMREPIQNIFVAITQRLQSIRGHIESQHGRESKLWPRKSPATGRNSSRHLASRVDRLDRLADRGIEVAGHVEAQIATSTEASQGLRETRYGTWPRRTIARSKMKRADWRFG